MATETEQSGGSDDEEGAYDIITVGGGLASGLLVLACRALAPELRIGVVERGPRFGGNHTWSFHHRDLGAAEPLRARHLSWFASSSLKRFPRHRVRFFDKERVIESPYYSLESAGLGDGVAEALGQTGGKMMLSSEAKDVEARRVVLSDGRVLTAPVVLDARGPHQTLGPRVGFQKFFGAVVQLKKPHALDCAELMDAAVPQKDGYRFVYTLPFSETELLIEDTYYSLNPTLNHTELENGLLERAANRGFEVTRIVRRESGVLPLPWAQDEENPHSDRQSEAAPRIGYAGGFFQPVTGYSFPMALRVAVALAEGLRGQRSVAQAPHERARDIVDRQRRKVRWQASFARFLNRMMFTAVAQENWWQIFSRFYRMPAASISRFYAMDMSPLDAARMVVGKPPAGFSIRALLATAETP